MLTGGPDAPGMNAVLRTVLRYAMNEGQDVVGVRYGFAGLAREDIWDLQWMDVQSWMAQGGSELGAVRHVLTEAEIAQVAETIRKWDIRGLIVVGGLDTYKEVSKLVAAREPVPRAEYPDDLRAGDDRQQPAGHRDLHRRRHCTKQHHGRGRQDQVYRRGRAPGLHRRSDGAGVRLPGAGERHRDRRRDGAAARGPG